MIAIDGRAGAGKTTLAQDLTMYLRQNHAVEVIHCDEIYNGWESALGPDLTETLSMVLERITSEREVELPIYDWHKGEFNSVRNFETPEILIIEGVGSGQRVVRNVAAITIWLDINPPTGLRRVLERDGYQIQTQMQKWQVAEDQHFHQERTRENSDFIFSTG